MANVTETSNFDEGVYQIEITDPLEGGALGVLNKSVKNLANRTKWLYDNLIKLIPKNTGYITGLDVGETTGNVSKSGDFTSAVSTESGNNTKVLMTMANSMGNTNYRVEFDIEGRSTSIYSDNTISAPIFRVISATQFELGIREFASEGQNLRVHMRVYSL